jgi:hypothetical protein
MTPTWKLPLESQFVAAVDMLENAIRACPDRVWNDGATPVQRRFWYLVFHTLFWLDFYLSESDAGFAPPAPFTLDEMDPAGVYPERAYTRGELLDYLAHGREKLRRAVGSLTEADASRRCGIQSREMSVLELHLYQIRHVQHHVAQLHLILRERTDSAPGWVGRGRLAPGG